MKSNLFINSKGGLILMEDEIVKTNLSGLHENGALNFLPPIDENTPAEKAAAMIIFCNDEMIVRALETNN
jgi:hypothetical protein